MSFQNIIGHETALAVLRRAVASDHLPTGYLFAGPPNIGKARAALALAQAVNCSNRSSGGEAEAVDGCGRCAVCEQIERGLFPYVQVLHPMLKAQEKLREQELKRFQKQEAKSGEEEDEDEELTISEWIEIEGAQILIEPVRRMLNSASLKAPEGVRKVFVLTSAEKIRDEAANHLLKTLEEPPPRTLFLLTTSRPSDVLPTIVSRCQVVDFGPVPRGEACAALQAQFAANDPEQVDAIVAASAGRFGWAQRMLSRPPLLTHRSELLDVLARLPACQLFEGMRIAEELIDLAAGWFLDAYEPGSRAAEAARRLLKSNRDHILRTVMIQLLDIMLSWWRDLTLLVSAGPASAVMNCDRLADLTELARCYHAGDCRRALRWLDEARGHFPGNANLRLTTELLVLKLISLAPVRA